MQHRFWPGVRHRIGDCQLRSGGSHLRAGSRRPKGRSTDRLPDVQPEGASGTLTVYIAPLYAIQSADIPPGSAWLANADTGTHDKLSDPDLGFWHRTCLHVVDTVGTVHATGLRIRALILPLQVLVFSGH
jgi:hypothetical protein